MELSKRESEHTRETWSQWQHDKTTNNIIPYKPYTTYDWETIDPNCMCILAPIETLQLVKGYVKLLFVLEGGGYLFIICG